MINKNRFTEGKRLSQKETKKYNEKKLKKKIEKKLKEKSKTKFDKTIANTECWIPPPS